MSYRYDKEKQQRSRRYLIGTVLIIAVFFTPLLSWLYNALERPLMSAWEQSNQNIENAQTWIQRLAARSAVQEENEELKKHIELLEVDVLRTTYLESVLESFQNVQDGATNVLPAQVLIRQSDNLMIDRGSSDGVLESATVLSESGVYIGRIVEVFDHSSQVQLLSTHEVQTAAVLFPREESIILVGHGSGYRAELPRDSEVEIGDVAYSQVQPGRIIAVVQSIDFDPRDPFKQVYFAAPTDMNRVQVVGVVQ